LEKKEKFLLFRYFFRTISWCF